MTGPIAGPWPYGEGKHCPLGIEFAVMATEDNFVGMLVAQEVRSTALATK